MTKTQDRSITLGGYMFDEKKHVHTLDGKPLTGVTTVLGVINKPMLIQWAANQACDYILENSNKRIDGTIESSELVIKEARVAHRKKKEAAGDWGTQIHTNIEAVIDIAIKSNGGFINGYWEHQPDSINNFIKWAIENKVKFLASEKHVHSKEMWIGGIADIICEIDGKRYVGDIKTSSGIYPEAFIQGSAYAECLKEMGEYKDGYQLKKCSICDGKGHTQKSDGDWDDCWNCGGNLETREKVSEAFDGVVIINLKKDGGFDVQYNYDLEGNLECFKAALKIYRHMNAITK